jgi:hypothetical protein
MLKKILLGAILVLQFAVVASVAADLPDPPCPPSVCPNTR